MISNIKISKENGPKIDFGIIYDIDNNNVHFYVDVVWESDIDEQDRRREISLSYQINRSVDKLKSRNL